MKLEGVGSGWAARSAVLDGLDVNNLLNLKELTITMYPNNTSARIESAPVANGEAPCARSRNVTLVHRYG